MAQLRAAFTSRLSGYVFSETAFLTAILLAFVVGNLGGRYSESGSAEVLDLFDLHIVTVGVESYGLLHVP
jgi:hypothetical protein